MYIYFLLFSHTCTAKVTSITILGVAICFHASWNETGKCICVINKTNSLQTK